MNAQQPDTHRCPYPAGGCTSPNCPVTASRFTERVIEALVRTDYDNAINCTGLGEVGCRGREGWHSWTEHRRHVAAAQLAELRRVGLIVDPPSRPAMTEGIAE